MLAELLPVIVARQTWHKQLMDQPLIVFLDNEGARESLVRGYSPVSDVASLLRVNAELQCQGHGPAWYARVPSASNVADGPSRGMFEVTTSLGATKVTPLAPAEGWTSLAL